MGEFKKKIGFVSLGCDKNRVDTENIITVLSTHDEFSFVGDKKEAEIIIINTCAFLKKSREESSSVIKEMSRLKEKGKLEKLIVAGCLSMLQKDALYKDFPCIDKVILPKDYEKIDNIIFDMYKEIGTKRNAKIKDISRKLTTPMHYAYLKIGDGCNNRCAYCMIPFIRGNYVSYPTEELIKEAKLLVEKGTREIILVAQDITRFGCDTKGKENLVMLLRELTKIKKLVWIRLLYCYPDMVSDELIAEIRDNPKVLNYIDIPLQHISDNVLKNMRRRDRKADIIALIEKLRKEMPDMKIRTTFMVGFPGETKSDVKELCNFLKTYKLDNVGFFKYSREKGTASYDFPNQIEESEKDKRLALVQSVQEKVINKKNKELIGQTFKVLCDSYDSEHHFYIGRTYFMAPDIDFEVLFTSNRNLNPGAFVDVEIVDFSQGYFIGKMEKSSTY